MMMLCGLAWLIILAVGGALGWQLVREQQRRARPREEERAEAMRVLEERYARGEIDREVFEERRRILSGSP